MVSKELSQAKSEARPKWRSKNELKAAAQPLPSDIIRTDSSIGVTDEAFVSPDASAEPISPTGTSVSSPGTEGEPSIAASESAKMEGTNEKLSSSLEKKILWRKKEPKPKPKPVLESSTASAPRTFTHSFDFQKNTTLLQSSSSTSPRPSLSSLSMMAASTQPSSNTAPLGKYLRTNAVKEDTSTKKDPAKPFKFSTPTIMSELGSSIKDIFDRNVTVKTQWTRPTQQEKLAEIALENLGNRGAIEELGEVTEGERRHMQHTERLKHQREEFQAKLPEAVPGARYRRNDAAGTPNLEQKVVLTAADIRKQLAAELRAQHQGGLAAAAAHSELRRTNAKSAPPSHRSPSVVKEIVIPVEGLTIRELASRCSLKLADVRSKLEELGESAADAGEGIIEADVVELLVLELGFEVKRMEAKRELGEALRPSVEEGQTIEPRFPVVCVMGHVCFIPRESSP